VDRYSPKRVLMLSKYANAVLLACWRCWCCASGVIPGAGQRLR
jgi:hypothetical protein